MSMNEKMEDDLNIDDSTTEDISTNMNGIKSVQLYKFLYEFTKQNTTEVIPSFKSIEPRTLIPLLIEHISDTIPNELFMAANSEVDRKHTMDWLALYCNKLDENFGKLNRLPFTIFRICQLCYDPLKYFKVNELNKFVNALGKCSIVTTPLNIDNPKKISDKLEIEEEEDVSLVKIPWIDEVKKDKDFPQFIKDIDNTMSVNFGFDEGEEDDEDGDIVQSNNMEIDNDIVMGNSNSNVIVEEYYEDDGDVDEDGVVRINNKDDDDDDDDTDYQDTAYGTDSESDSEEDDQEEVDETQPELKVVPKEADKKTPRKRKPTELDIFDYSETNTSSDKDLTTPKKLKQEGRVIDSPIVGNGKKRDNDSNQKSESDSKDTTTDEISEDALKQSMLCSPVEEDMSKTERTDDKIRAITDDNDGSPLNNKTR